MKIIKRALLRVNLKDMKSVNISDSKKVVFFHNPKCAGSTVKKILDLTGLRTDHRVADEFVTKKTWEDYFTFTVVRHPYDRFVSSYFYHTSECYKGLYYNINNNLHSLSMSEYFQFMMVNQKGGIRPNIDYTHHSKSDQKIDMILKFESLGSDLKMLCSLVGVKYIHTHENKGIHQSYSHYLDADLELKSLLYKYYQEDFKAFGYDA